jgi:hypothetical protein
VLLLPNPLRANCRSLSYGSEGSTVIVHPRLIRQIEKEWLWAETTVTYFKAAVNFLATKINHNNHQWLPPFFLYLQNI